MKTALSAGRSNRSRAGREREGGRARGRGRRRDGRGRSRVGLGWGRKEAGSAAEGSKVGSQLARLCRRRKLQLQDDATTNGAQPMTARRGPGAAGRTSNGPALPGVLQRSQRIPIFPSRYDAGEVVLPFLIRPPWRSYCCLLHVSIFLVRPAYRAGYPDYRGS